MEGKGRGGTAGGKRSQLLGAQAGLSRDGGGEGPGPAWRLRTRKAHRMVLCLFSFFSSRIYLSEALSSRGQSQDEVKKRIQTS